MRREGQRWGGRAAGPGAILTTEHPDGYHLQVSTGTPHDAEALRPPAWPGSPGGLSTRRAPRRARGRQPPSAASFESLALDGGRRPGCPLQGRLRSAQAGRKAGSRPVERLLASGEERERGAEGAGPAAAAAAAAAGKALQGGSPAAGAPGSLSSPRRPGARRERGKRSSQ